MFKTVLFDLDDTLFDFKKAEATALAKTLSQQGITPSDENISLYSKINASMWKRLETGELTRAQILVMRFEEFFNKIGATADAKTTKEIYEKNLSVGHFFIDGAYELLEKLHNDYDLYLVSNGTFKVQEGRLNSSNIKRFFKGIFISEKIGFVKPQKEFFDNVFKEISNFEIDKTIIIGDSLSSDILGGNNAGIKTCWFNSKQIKNETNAIVDYEIHKLDDVYNILKDGSN